MPHEPLAYEHHLTSLALYSCLDGRCVHSHTPTDAARVSKTGAIPSVFLYIGLFCVTVGVSGSCHCDMCLLLTLT